MSENLDRSFVTSPEDRATIAKCELMYARRKKGEKLQDLAQRLLLLVYEGYPNYTEDQVHLTARDEFVDCLEGDLRIRVMAFLPENLSAAVCRAQCLEIVDASKVVEPSPAPDQEPKKNFVCWGCRKPGHKKADCWVLHPEKRPKGNRF